MTPITAAWLEERGLLHDARVLAAHVEGATVRISIDDEWSNEHDDADEGYAGAMVFQNAAILEGDIAAIEHGWISQVEHRDGNVVFDFCDRDRLVIKATVATWQLRSAKGRERP